MVKTTHGGGEPGESLHTARLLHAVMHILSGTSIPRGVLGAGSGLLAHHADIAGAGNQQRKKDTWHYHMSKMKPLPES